MRSNLFAVSLFIKPLLLCFYFLGYMLGRNGYSVASGIIYILVALLFIGTLWLTRCPRCGWPMILDLRRHPGDCPRCGSEEDIKLS